MADLGREPHLKERSDAQMCVNRLCRNTVPYCSTLPDIYEYRSFGRGVLLSSESQYLSPRTQHAGLAPTLQTSFITTCKNGLIVRLWMEVRTLPPLQRSPFPYQGRQRHSVRQTSLPPAGLPASMNDLQRTNYGLSHYPFSQRKKDHSFEWSF